MTADIAFFWVVFWCYLGASILYVLGLALPRLRAARSVEPQRRRRPTS